MSKLDDLLDGYMAIMYRDDKKQQIKDLFLELIGEDEPRPAYCCGNEGGLICFEESKVKARNALRTELRKKVSEL